MSSRAADGPFRGFGYQAWRIVELWLECLDTPDLTVLCEGVEDADQEVPDASPDRPASSIQYKILESFGKPGLVDVLRHFKDHWIREGTKANRLYVLHVAAHTITKGVEWCLSEDPEDGTGEFLLGEFNMSPEDAGTLAGLIRFVVIEVETTSGEFSKQRDQVRHRVAGLPDIKSDVPAELVTSSLYLHVFDRCCQKRLEDRSLDHPTLKALIAGDLSTLAEHDASILHSHQVELAGASLRKFKASESAAVVHLPTGQRLAAAIVPPDRVLVLRDDLGEGESFEVELPNSKQRLRGRRLPTEGGEAAILALCQPSADQSPLVCLSARFAPEADGGAHRNQVGGAVESIPERGKGVDEASRVVTWHGDFVGLQSRDGRLVPWSNLPPRDLDDGASFQRALQPLAFKRLRDWIEQNSLISAQLVQVQPGLRAVVPARIPELGAALLLASHVTLLERLVDGIASLPDSDPNPKRRALADLLKLAVSQTVRISARREEDHEHVWDVLASCRAAYELSISYEYGRPNVLLLNQEGLVVSRADIEAEAKPPKSGIQRKAINHGAGDWEASVMSTLACWLGEQGKPMEHARRLAISQKVRDLKKSGHPTPYLRTETLTNTQIQLARELGLVLLKKHDADYVTDSALEEIARKALSAIEELELKP